MADPDANDTLGASLSDEETEALISKTSRASPQRSTAKNQGFKFNTDNVKPDFDFKKSSEATQDANTSSSDPDPDEGFEFLETTEDIDEANSVPTTPMKLTPHKRAADGAGESVVTNGANGSPPSSPAPKKRKQFEEYVQEFEAKNKKAGEKGKVMAAAIKLKRYLLDNYMVILGFIFTAWAIWAGVRCYSGNCPDTSMVTGNLTKPRYSWNKVKGNFLNWTKKLEPEFPKQNRGTWIQLIASISETMKKTEPKHPAVITVLFPPSMSKEFPNCFVQKVGNIVNKAVAPYYDSLPAEVKQIDPAALESSPISDFRIEIEEYFKRQGMAVIIFDVDQIKSEDYLYVIQGLCDSYHAVFKRATYLFPVQVSQEIFEKFDWIHERGGDIANDVLNEAWKTTLSPDSGPALVARVADAVIVLNEGDECKL